MLVGGIMGNLENLFTSVNNQVGEIAGQVGTTPAAWNPGVFSLIRQLSETVILPIAGLVLTFIATYELIQLIVDKNNLHDVDTWMMFKWVFKTFMAVMILSNAFNIVMAVFDVTQSVVNSSAGIIGGSISISPDVLAELENELMALDIGPLLGLMVQSFIAQGVTLAVGFVISIIVYGRLIEIYLLTSLAPIPLATLSNREFGGMGQNYFKSLCAIGFQGVLIIVCVAIYAVMIQSIGTATSDGIFGAIWAAMGYTLLLCFTLFKTGSLAKAILGAH